MNSINSAPFELGVFSKATDNFAGWIDRLSVRRSLSLIIPIYHCTRELVANIHDDGLIGEFSEVILVLDSSPDKSIQNSLISAFEKWGNKIRCITNLRNLGFIRSVNKGIRESNPNNDLVILNSDARVNAATVRRLSISAHAFGNVATAGPLSNSNGFFSVNPTSTFLEGFDLDIAHQWASIHAHQLHEECPANNGFCLYISRNAINGIGLLDELMYYRGYAEETDFCMRATQSGFRNLVSFTSFGAHSAGSSFGAEKSTLQKVNGRILRAVFPEFGNSLRSYEETSLITTLKGAASAGRDTRRINSFQIDVNEDRIRVLSGDHIFLSLEYTQLQGSETFDICTYLVFRFFPERLAISESAKLTFDSRERLKLASSFAKPGSISTPTRH
jgi:GT2 family glycosyltransferase